MTDLLGGDRVRDLGAVRSDPLRNGVAGLDAACWRQDASRQTAFEVHRDTESIVLLFMDTDAWPRIVVRRGAGWDLLGATASKLMDELIAAHYGAGGVVLRAMCARLPPGGRITPHRDKHRSFHRSHRVHVPLTTNARVRFVVDGVPHRFTVGHAFEIDNQKSHSVMNNGESHRIHFLFDYLPPAQLAGPGLARD